MKVVILSHYIHVICLYLFINCINTQFNGNSTYFVKSDSLTYKSLVTLL